MKCIYLTNTVLSQLSPQQKYVAEYGCYSLPAFRHCPRKVITGKIYRTMPIAKSLAIKVRHVSSHLPSACKHGVLGDAVAARATGRANAAVAILFESVVFVLISAIPYFRGHGQSVVSLPAL